MFSQRVREIVEPGKLVTAAPTASVSDAALVMAGKNVGAVLVMDGERLVGIFSERDVVLRVVAQGRNPRATTLSEVMTPDPKTIDANSSFGSALAIMHAHGFRHLPVMDQGKLIGVVSARSALDPELEEFVSEARRREAFSKVK